MNKSTEVSMLERITFSNDSFMLANGSIVKPKPIGRVLGSHIPKDCNTERFVADLTNQQTFRNLINGYNITLEDIDTRETINETYVAMQFYRIDGINGSKVKLLLFDNGEFYLDERKEKDSSTG